MKTMGLSGSMLHWWGGLAFMFANVLFFVNKLNEMSRVFLGWRMADVISGETLALVFVGQIALIVGFIAYYRAYAPRVGRGGKVALRLLSGGGIVLAIGHISFMSALENYLPTPATQLLEYLFLLVILGAFGLFIGLIWFGILTLRQPILIGWHWLPLVTGLMGLIGFVGLGGEEITAPFLLFRSLFALGLIGLGGVLALEKPPQVELATP